MGSGRDEAHQIERTRLQCRFQRRVRTQRQVGGEDSVGAGLDGPADEGIRTPRVDRVQIGEDDDRDLAGLAQLREDREDVGDGGPLVERPLAGALDGRPVGHRIAEGDPQFDHVGPHIRQPRQQLAGVREGGIARGHVRDEPRPALRGQPLEACGDPAPRRSCVQDAAPARARPLNGPVTIPLRHAPTPRPAHPRHPVRRRAPRPCRPVRSGRSQPGPRPRPGVPPPPPRPARARSPARE